MTEQHCPGCRGYAGPNSWDEECPGLPVPEAPLARAPLDIAGHETWGPSLNGMALLDGLCHCRIGKPHREGALAGYDQEHAQEDPAGRADGHGPSRPRP